MSRALDLLGRLCPPLESRLEVALERLELCPELVGRPSAVGTRVERRVLERRYYSCHLRFELRHPSFRFLELALRLKQRFPRVAFRSWSNPLMLVHPSQRLFLGGAHRGSMRSLRAHFFPLRETPGELGHVALVQDPDPCRQRAQQ